MVSSVRSHATHAVSNILQPQPTTRLLSFDEFWKRKSNERAQHAVKKKQQMPPKEVLVVGIMHRYLIYTRWCILHCGQAKIEAVSHALVVPTELTCSMIICVFCIAEMDKVDNKSCFTDEFKEKASFESDFRFEDGYTKPFVTMSDKEEFLRAVALHYTLLMSLSEANQFDGLKICNILQLVREYPGIFRSLFEVRNSKLTAEDIDSIFDPQFSPVGSNKFTTEQNIVFYFNQYLEDVQNGLVVSQVKNREVTVSLNQVFEFATGAQHVPAVGFSSLPIIEFLHHLNTPRKISANTCANILRFPVNELCDQEKFNEEFTFCLLNSPGFQLL